MFDESDSILGALPSALLFEITTTFGFESIKFHKTNRPTAPYMNISSNSWYIAFLYNQIANLAATHSDTRIVLNRSLTTNENTDIGL